MKMHNKCACILNHLFRVILTSINGYELGSVSGYDVNSRYHHDTAMVDNGLLRVEHYTFIGFGDIYQAFSLPFTIVYLFIPYVALLSFVKTQDN